MQRPPAVGYVVFDNPITMSQGWAARASDTKARMINGTHDLPTDTVWIFNTEWEAMRDQQLHHNTLYRNCRYFGPPLPKVLRDLGVPEGANQDQALIGAQIAGRVLLLYNAIFNCTGIPPNRLASAIREQSGGAPDNIVDPVIDQALTDASEMFDWVRDPTGSQEEGEDVVLRIHPLQYAATLLCSIIPDDQSPPIWDDHPPATPNMEWLTQNAPLLARLTINSQERIVSLLLNFGTTGDDGSQRRFVTHYELSRLLGSKVKLRVHQTVRWASAPNRFQALRRLVEHLISECGGVFLASESVMLFGEILWRAAATRMPPKVIRKANAQRYRNIAAPFLHAYGRITCANVALELIQHGILVRRQGYGQIGILMREREDWRALADLCVRHRLLPPVFSPAHAIADYRPPPGENTEDPVVLSIAMRVRGQMGMLLNMDTQLVDSVIQNIAHLA